MTASVALRPDRRDHGISAVSIAHARARAAEPGVALPVTFVPGGVFVPAGPVDFPTQVRAAPAQWIRRRRRRLGWGAFVLQRRRAAPVWSARSARGRR